MEIDYRSVKIPVEAGGGAGQARREAIILSQRIGFNETQKGNVAIVATEAATNLAKHAGGGLLLLRALHFENSLGLELLAIDSGPGMHDTRRCMADGFSTAGSPGTGLGAISRLSSFFDIYSEPGKGTVLVAQFRPAGAVEEPALLVGAVCVSIMESEPSGDAWACQAKGNRKQLLVVDGLGHGVLAARAADEAVRVFQASSGSAPAECLQTMHGPLRATRGASAAIAELDLERGNLCWSGVGNISGTVWHEGVTRSMVSHNGTIGHELHRVSEFTYPFARNSVLVMHSDGVNSRWKLDQYPGLVTRHPSLIAAIVHRDFQRGRDDATVVVARES